VIFTINHAHNYFFKGYYLGVEFGQLDILETREVKGFNAIVWIRKQIDGVKREFEKDYDLSRIAVGISAGIPSGVSGSLTVTLSPKLLKEPF
jgi:hypothetical protein